MQTKSDANISAVKKILGKFMQKIFKEKAKRHGILQKRSAQVTKII